ncbi:glycosyltransferase family 4 protein [Lachnospiraceae bacterium ZAX-1]
MKILFTTNIPSPYRMDFFNEVGKYCDLTVIFEKSATKSRDKSWSDFRFTHFKGIFIKRDERSISFGVMKMIKKGQYDYTMVCNPMTPIGMLTILYLKHHKILYGIEGDGAFLSQKENRIKYRVKRTILRGADSYFSTCRNHDDYYKRYVGKMEQVYRYPFSSILKKDILCAPLNALQKKDLRQQLGIKEEKVILAIGQFIKRKGFDLLLKAATMLKKEIGIYMVGGYSKEYEQFKEVHNLSNVHFIPFKKKNELQAYMDASDLFVLPTREDIWGLVINEVMARGLPVITTERCNAGLVLVTNQVNGYIIPADNVEELANRVDEILYTKDMEEMGRRSLDKIRGYTVEKMAEVHMQHFRKILNE